MIYQYTNQHYENSKQRAILNFVSRLHWHCHFMQKFEDECRMEFENVEPMILGCQKMKRISKPGKKENRRTNS
jgi:hypothetical protein